MNKNWNGSDQYPRKRVLWGVILIAAGCMFLLDRMDIYEIGDIWRYWPAVISIAGLIEILTARGMRDISRGTMNVVVGLWLYACIENIWGLTFGNSWPVLMITFGIGVFLNGIADRNQKL